MHKIAENRTQMEATSTKDNVPIESYVPLTVLYK